MKKVISIVALLAMATTAGAATTVLNGSFEAGTNPGSFLGVAAGGTDITNWSVGLRGVDYIGTYWQPADGERSIDLNRYGAGEIYQVLSTVAGDSYKVSFALSGNPNSTGGVRTVNVSATGALGQNYSYDTVAKGNTLANMKWQMESYTFTATTISTILKFESVSHDNGFGPAIDAVSICPVVPVPGALLLGGLGTALVGMLRRRYA